MPSDLPPPPIACALSEHRQGPHIQIEAEIRSRVARFGKYRFSVGKHGPSGSAHVSQQSDFTIGPASTVTVRGPQLSVEPNGHYRARFVIRTDDGEYTCEREGPDASDPP